MAALDYSRLKELHSSPAGQSVNPFFHKHRSLDSYGDLTTYQYIIDTINDKAYERPYVTVDRLTTPARYFIPYSGPVTCTQDAVEGPRITPEEMRTRISGAGQRYYYINTVAGPHLVVHQPVPLPPQQIADLAYQTIARNSIARARRGVIHSDRQVHWVWFRKPGYRLTEEIVLRAGSWIELNPAMRFHLWTSLSGPEELADFLCDLPVELRESYFKKIDVHYQEEFHDAIFCWLEQNISDTTVIDVFHQVWISSERQDIVMKTDYSRNILLAIYGGIYTDFNDLLCLAPVEPLLIAHAGSCIGVSDNLTANNASNYFMYAGEDCQEWQDIVRRQTATIVEVRNMIYDQGALEYARHVMLDLLDGRLPQDSRDAALLTTRHLVFTICLTVREITRHPDLSQFIRKHSHGRMREDFIGKAAALLARPEIADTIRTAVWDTHWRHARTDCLLTPIMHRTNLPIYCRQQGIPIFLHPHGYLLRYGSMMSYVGHLGDASSYGNEAQNKTSMRRLLSGAIAGE
jgi:hypothetical protein